MLAHRAPLGTIPMGRIHAFDWLRGVAVLVMIQTHCIALLRPELKTGSFFRNLDAIDGLVAPAFIFCAGFALALVQVRAGLAGTLAAQARKSAARIGEVWVVAGLVNLIWFPWHPLFWFLRFDILHCIAASLTLILPLLVWLSKKPGVLRWVLLSIALALFAVSPLAESLTGPAQLFFNNKPGVLDDATYAAFPLLPWAGYVFLGASFGTTVGAMKSERELWAWIALLMTLGLAAWFFGSTLEDVYPPHEFWKTNPADAARRWTLVLTLVAIFRLLERTWPRLISMRVTKWLATFGTASLSAYFFHEMLLFQRWVGVFGRCFRGQADWPVFWLLVPTVIGCTWVCVQLWNRAEPKLRARFTSTAAPPRPAS
ncbi:MAG: heparan-alpha-glucosaminide N-acetyltransferase domain-containing protein [Archangium sp.]